jgi:hypothetical protein
MINNPDWNQPEESAYFHQISQDCIEKLTECMEGINTDEIDCDTCLIMQEILCDEIDDPEFLEFAIDSLNELLSYIESGRTNIRIHRNDVDELWFDVDEEENSN